MSNKIGLSVNGEKTLMGALERDLPVFVTFRTKRGYERTMECSRSVHCVPQDGKDDPKLNNDKIIAVYDYQNSAWRSFRKDSVLYFEV
jgi:hypothetical protein